MRRARLDAKKKKKERKKKSQSTNEVINDQCLPVARSFIRSQRPPPRHAVVNPALSPTRVVPGGFSPKDSLRDDLRRWAIKSAGGREGGSWGGGGGRAGGA